MNELKDLPRLGTESPSMLLQRTDYLPKPPHIFIASIAPGDVVPTETVVEAPDRFLE